MRASPGFCNDGAKGLPNPQYISTSGKGSQRFLPEPKRSRHERYAIKRPIAGQSPLTSGQVVVEGGTGILGGAVLTLATHRHVCAISLHFSEEGLSLWTISQC